MSQFSDLRDELRSEGWEIEMIETTYCIRLTQGGDWVEGYGDTVTVAMQNASAAARDAAIQ